MKWLFVAIILVVCCGLFLVAYNPQTEERETLSPASDTRQEESVQELPPCPSETATGCRKVQNEKFVVECTGEGPVSLSSPMRYEDIGIIIPMGAMIGGHVTPIDHMYFQPIVFQSPPDSYDVLADADGVITSIGLEGDLTKDNPGINSNKKYRVVVYHTCDFYSIYNLITSLSPSIEAVTGEIAPGFTKTLSIPVKKGEILGRIGGQTLDLSVNYDKSILRGFLEPSSYEGEPWKIHTVDPFDYWDEETNVKLMEKNIRRVPPYGGKIDYDLQGKLAGNWFVENTNGYRGVNPSKYWETHLSFVYNEIDPSFVMISIGDFGGEAKQFGVKGNSPNPADVDSAKGIVTYELVEFHYNARGEIWDRMTFADDVSLSEGNEVKGTVLVEVTDTRKIKVEAFPGKKASEVSGFTENAKMYTR